MEQVTNAQRFLLIDLTTGTVLDDNVVAVPKSLFSDEEWDEITSSDERAFQVGMAYGNPLKV